MPDDNTTKKSKSFKRNSSVAHSLPGDRPIWC